MLQSLRPIDGDGGRRAHVVRAQYAAGFDDRRAGARLPRGDRRRRRTRAPRPSSRCSCSSTTGAGPACRSSCAPASGCRSGPARSAIHLKEVPPILFNARSGPAPLEPNVLTIRIQPDEGFALGIASKVPGPRVRIYPVKMDFRYSSTFGASVAGGLRAAAARRDGRRRRRCSCAATRRGVVALGRADSRALGRADRAAPDLPRRRLESRGRRSLD